MALRCECGGVVEIVDGSDPDGGPEHVELYECVQCGRRGTYHFGGDQRERTTGCVTIDAEVTDGRF